MSASREKRERKVEVVVTDTVKKEKKKAPKSGKLGDRFYTGIGIAIALVLVISLGVSLFQNVVGSGKNFAALDVAEEKVYPHEVNFYYVNSYMNFVNSYGDYLSYMGLDTTKSLKGQQYDDDQTWHEYFLVAAENSVQEIKMLSKDAAAQGVTLSDEYKAQIDLDVKSLESSASESDYTLEGYLTTYYGKSMTVDEYRRILSESYLAQQYGSQVNKSYTYSNDDLKAYYDANTKDFDVVDYRYFFFSATSDVENPTESDTAAAKTAAKAMADIMQGSITDEKSFIDLSLQNASEDQKTTYEDESATLNESASYSDVSSVEAMAEWLFSADRVNGDTTVIETDSGYYVMYMKSRYRNDYNTANVRHILVQYELAEEATEPTDEQKTAAKKAAEAILKEWKDGDATEDNFAALATVRSEDGGSAANGGLYENVYKGQMVASFEDWSFDPTRKTGDTGIVETSYGYHVMYYVSEGTPYWTIQVDTVLRNKDYEEFRIGLKEKYPIKERNIGLSAVGLPE